MNEISPSQRMWRTLIRVTSKHKDGVLFEIPGRTGMEEKIAWCSKDNIPSAIFETMKRDARYHVECNFGCEDITKLRFEKWEDK